MDILNGCRIPSRLFLPFLSLKILGHSVQDCICFVLMKRKLLYSMLFLGNMSPSSSLWMLLRFFRNLMYLVMVSLFLSCLGSLEILGSVCRVPRWGLQSDTHYHPLDIILQISGPGSFFPPISPTFLFLYLDDFYSFFKINSICAVHNLLLIKSIQ